MNFSKAFSLTLLSILSIATSCMEISNNVDQAQSLVTQQPMTLDLNAIPTDITDSKAIKALQKLETIQWLLNTIRPLNNGRYHPLHKGAQANCTLIAEKCIRVLAGLDTPSLVPVKREDLDITFKENDQGSIVYHEIIRQEQAQLVSPQQFIETVEVLEGTAKAQVDLTQTLERTSLKYITSTLSAIAQDIQSLPGSTASQSKDKTLSGLIYYYYKDLDAGHLANFYRDKYGNLFFVDAQSESITKVPPTKILDYELKDEVFFYALPPKSGYYIKKEPGLLQEQPDTMVAHTYLADIAKASLAKSAVKLQLKDKEIQEQTNSMPYILDQEASKENSIEENGSTNCSDNQKNVTGHKRKRVEEKSYMCDQCNKAFTTPGNLSRHKRIHTGEKPYKCNYSECNKAFITSSDLNIHKRIHTREKPHKCDQCDKAFTTSSNLNKHKRTHTGEKPYKCNYPECNKAFTQHAHLIEHTYTHTSEKPFKCDYPECDKAFTNSNNLNTHKRIHTGEKPYKCNQCNFSTAYPNDLKLHKRTHTEEKPYKCDYPECEKAFTQSSALTKHKLTHTKEKPHQCDLCNKAFTTSSNLNRHQLTHTTEKPYECDQCDFSTAYPNSLKLHKRTHTGEKPFKCDYRDCDKAFATAGNLDDHKRLHTGEKPYKCDYPECNKAFTQSNALTKHKLTHTEEKPHQCDLCNYSSTTSSNLKRHKLTHAED